MMPCFKLCPSALFVQCDLFPIKHQAVLLTDRLDKINGCIKYTVSSIILTDKVDLTFHILSLDLARLIYGRQ